jgi:hypothetical protein
MPKNKGAVFQVAGFTVVKIGTEVETKHGTGFVRAVDVQYEPTHSFVRTVRDNKELETIIKLTQRRYPGCVRVWYWVELPPASNWVIFQDGYVHPL